MNLVNVSIIITTYNGEKTLKKAIDSWLSQTLDNCEIVITDDCSKDSTRQIIAEYALKYPERIVANYMGHNTRNSGAINRGVEIAKGKYVAIVDQDDWADPTMIEKLFLSAEKDNADVACCDMARADSNGNILSIENGNTKDQIWGGITREKRKLLFLAPGSRLCKIFKKDFLVKNKIEHCDNVCYGDNYFMEHIAAYCQKISRVDEALYYYRIDNESSTRSYNNPVTYDRVKSAELMIESLTERGFLNDYREEIEFRFIELFYVNSINVFLKNFRPCEIEEIRYLRNVIKQTYSNYRKNKYFIARITKKNKILTLLCDISPLLLCKSYMFYTALKNFLLHKQK